MAADTPWAGRLRQPVRVLHSGGECGTGELKWHYQAVPGDSWDIDTVQQLILADIEIEGRVRKVLIQASKGGFLYVLDRITGQFLSATPFAPLNWASGDDAGGRLKNDARRTNTTTSRPRQADVWEALRTGPAKVQPNRSTVDMLVGVVSSDVPSRIPILICGLAGRIRNVRHAAGGCSAQVVADAVSAGRPAADAQGGDRGAFSICGTRSERWACRGRGGLRPACGDVREP